MRPANPSGRMLREDGFTMIIALMALFIGSLLVGGALAAVNGDIHLTTTDTNQKKAYFAALAGIDEYKYQISANPNYWVACPEAPENFATTKVPTAVPGTTDETYHVTTMGANGNAKCTPAKQATIIEAAGSASGTFRVKSTGTVGTKGTAGFEERSIVATFKHPGFLNYVFLSNYEVEDPTTLTPQPANCEHYYAERVAKGYTKECPPIDFIPEDRLNGPFHTNDAVAICGVGESPAFGRASNPSDPVEMNGGHYAATDNAACKDTPKIEGKYTTAAPTLLPPEEPDKELLEAAGYIFKGRTIIQLKEGSPNMMAITSFNTATKKFETQEKIFPANGVVYVENEASCPGYSPFVFDAGYETDETTPTCANVYIKGTYTESLTVASANDVIINGNIETTHEGSGKPTGAATLGLIAHNFVRVYHPVKKTGSGKNTSLSCEGENQTAATDPRGWGSMKNAVVDAAILATRHSWIVDNFTCGASLEKLTVWGAIAQYWRGRVTGGPFIGGGYPSKNYNYDERLATLQPPSFLAPTTTSGWKVTRETQP